MMVWSQIRRRGGRSVALMLAILIAAGGFTVLTASSAASRLQTVGTVNAHALPAYDVLVRPKGTRSALEKSQDLVQPGFLTGIYGGITLDQWRKIKALPGIKVAAPVAMVGYVVPQLLLPINMRPALPTSGDGVARMDVTWSFDNGLSREQQAPDFAYLTTNSLPRNPAYTPDAGMFLQKGSGAGAPTICPNGLVPPTATLSTRPSTIDCFSRTEGGASGPAGLVGRELSFPLPVVVAAVDPAEENKLDGLNGAVTSGSSLTGASLTDPRNKSGQVLPVLAGDTPATGVSATVTVSRLAGGAVSLVQRGATAGALSGQPREKVSESTFTAVQAYRLLLRVLKDPKPDKGTRGDSGLAGLIFDYATVSLPQFAGGSILTPISDPPGPVDQYPNLAYPNLTPGFADRHLRSITPVRPDHLITEGVPTPATLLLRGTFDPAKLKGLSDVTAQILSGYMPAPVFGADARSQRLLGGRALAPSPNIAGLVQPPPLMITTLAALPQLTQGWEPSTAAAPISAVRVRVAGVTGVDPLSRERVRLAAQQISQATGLDVDVTVGSSATAKTVLLPAGLLGRPELQLSQWWVKKGVAVVILKAVDKKSLILFCLVLLVCALSVANSAVASVRARRSELGVLACLGWRRRHLFAIVLAELAAVALVAGAAATVLSVGLGAVTGTHVSWQRGLLAVPAALAVALVAGMVPAWLAARADPMEAVRAAVHLPRRARAPRTVTGLGLVNLTRTRARALIAASGLTVSVAAFTLLLAITVAFQGAVVGTILGDAVAVQARGADYAATAATLLLAGLGVANVLYLNIRDRGAEIATLRALGWQEKHLARLVIVEGLGIGLMGALPGAAVGLGAAAVLAGAITAKIVLAAAIAVVVGLAITAVASAVPVRLLRRLPTAVLLTEE